MARTKKTPADALAEIQARIDALIKEGEDLSAQQGDAEAMIRSYPSRLDEALTLKKLGEQVELLDEGEQARLQGFVENAKKEQAAIKRARRLREEEREKVIARSRLSGRWAGEGSRVGALARRPQGARPRAGAGSRLSLPRASARGDH